MNKKNLVLLTLSGLILLLGLALWLVIDTPPPSEPPDHPVDTPNELTEIQQPKTHKLAKPEQAVSPQEPESEQNKAKIEVVLKASWGDGPDQLGHRIPEEGAPEGPMAFTIDDQGRLYILDQVNKRVQIFENGKRVASLDLPADTFQDLELSAKGDVVVMDRLSQKSLSIYGPDGTELGQVPIEGTNVPEGGGTTGLFAKEDGLWVEVEHQRQVRVADADGNPDSQRPMLPGRFSADGQHLLMAARSGVNRVAIQIRPAAQPQSPPILLAELAFPMAVMQIVALQSDTFGRVYLAVQLMRQGARPPFGPGDLGEQIAILDAAGRELARLNLPVRTSPEEQFRPYRIGADGALYQLLCGTDGATMNRISY